MHYIIRDTGIYFLYRKRSFGIKDNIPVSVNAAHKDIAVDHKKELYYENLDDMKSTQQQPDHDDEPVAASTTDPTASEHISTMFIEANITH